jgi:hypothetical protein
MIYSRSSIVGQLEIRHFHPFRGLGGGAPWAACPPDDAATKLNRLYGDLDHAHGVYEGNSRALREFTEALPRR